MRIPGKLACVSVVIGAVLLFVGGEMFGGGGLSLMAAHASSARICPGAVGHNPYCYTLTATNGTRIRKPASGLCRYVSCDSTFWKQTRGYVVECKDGRYSHSGGIRGACSRDKGVKQLLYAHLPGLVRYP